MEKYFEDKELFRRLWETSDVGLAIVSEEGFFLRANPFLCSILGYTQLELQTLKFHDITLPSDIDFDDKSSKEVMKGADRDWETKD